MFGHWFEILIILGLGLLVFGPKRMVEMGSQFGKMFREFQSSLKEMNWSLTGSADDDEKPATVPGATVTKFTDFAQNMLARSDESPLDHNTVDAVPASATTEKAVEPTPEEAAKSSLN